MLFQRPGRVHDEWRSSHQNHWALGNCLMVLFENVCAPRFSPLIENIVFRSSYVLDGFRTCPCLLAYCFLLAISDLSTDHCEDPSFEHHHLHAARIITTFGSPRRKCGINSVDVKRESDNKSINKIANILCWRINSWTVRVPASHSVEIWLLPADALPAWTCASVVIAAELPTRRASRMLYGTADARRESQC